MRAGSAGVLIRGRDVGEQAVQRRALHAPATRTDGQGGRAGERGRGKKTAWGRRRSRHTPTRGQALCLSCLPAVSVSARACLFGAGCGAPPLRYFLAR